MVYLCRALVYEPASVTTQMRSWAGNEKPCHDHPLRHFGLTGPPVHVDFNNPGRLGNRLFQAALAISLRSIPVVALIPARNPYQYTASTRGKTE